MNNIVKCSKCNSYLFYLPAGYEMDIQVTCVDCHKGRKKSKRKSNIQTASSVYSKVKKGKRLDIHPTYSFRSRTEANFARILEHKKLKWKFEERVFTFSHFGYKTKPFIYIMDFEILTGDGLFSPGFYEIKGRMDGRSRNKLRRLKKCYPDESSKTTVVIYNKYRKKDIEFCESLGYRYMFYDELTKVFSPEIPTWE